MPVVIAQAISGRRWRHKKRGSTYTEVGRALMQSTAPEWDDTEMVVYRADVTNTLYVRSVAEFEDGRFERIDLVPVSYSKLKM